jgi:5-methylcytosine-specific restriction endonuclease McrA
MNKDTEKLIKDIQKTRKLSKKLDYKIKILYSEQYQKKVKDGYEKWRCQEDGGIKFVRGQLQTFDNKCPVCHEKLTEKTATIDHLRPKFKYLGDALAIDNMLIMCNSCNGAKGGKEIKDWCKNLPEMWRKRTINAIEKIHGKSMLIKLGLVKI